MIKKTLLIAVLFALALGACKKDSTDKDPAFCSGIWATEVADELNAVSAAAMAYAANPSHETCVAYKDAFQDYIDALKKFGQCALWTPQQKADLQNAIDQAEDDKDTLCDE